MELFSIRIQRTFQLVSTAVVQPFKHFFHSISNTLSVPVAKFLICQIGRGYSE